MKKIWIFLPLALLLAFTACAPALVPGEGNPDTPSTAAPSIQPSEQPTQPDPTESVAVQPLFSELEIFIYGKSQPMGNPDLSACKQGHLYYYYAKENTVTAICDEPVLCYADDNTNLYFVKEAEPTKIVCAPQTDLTQQNVIYESDFGTINHIYPQTVGVYEDKILTLTEGNKRGVLLDLVTGETTVVIEQYYIELASIEDLKELDGKPSYSKIWFRGKLNESDSLCDYFLWTDSGTITKMEDE